MKSALNKFILARKSVNVLHSRFQAHTLMFWEIFPVVVYSPIAGLPMSLWLLFCAIQKKKYNKIRFQPYLIALDRVEDVIFILSAFAFPVTSSILTLWPVKFGKLARGISVFNSGDEQIIIGLILGDFFLWIIIFFVYPKMYDLGLYICSDQLWL